MALSVYVLWPKCDARSRSHLHGWACVCVVYLPLQQTTTVAVQVKAALTPPAMFTVIVADCHRQRHLQRPLAT